MIINFLTGAGARAFVYKGMVNDASMEISLRNVIKLKTYQLFLIRFDVTKVLKIKSCSFAVFLDSIANGLFSVGIIRRAFKELKQILICKFQTSIALMVFQNT